MYQNTGIGMQVSEYRKQIAGIGTLESEHMNRET